jgi:hypothetical protein
MRMTAHDALHPTAEESRNVHDALLSHIDNGKWFSHIDDDDGTDAQIKDFTNKEQLDQLKYNTECKSPFIIAMLDPKKPEEELLRLLIQEVKTALEGFADPETGEYPPYIIELLHRLNNIHTSKLPTLKNDLGRAKNEPYKVPYTLGALFDLQYFGGFEMGDGIEMDKLKQYAHDLKRKMEMKYIFCVEAPSEIENANWFTETTLVDGETFVKVNKAETFMCWTDDDPSRVKVIKFVDIEFGCIFVIPGKHVFVCHLSSGSEAARNEQISQMFSNKQIRSCDFIIGDFNGDVKQQMETHGFIVDGFSDDSVKINKPRYKDNMLRNNQYLKGSDKPKNDYMGIFKKIWTISSPPALKEIMKELVTDVSVADWYNDDYTERFSSEKIEDSAYFRMLHPLEKEKLLRNLEQIRSFDEKSMDNSTYRRKLEETLTSIVTNRR